MSKELDMKFEKLFEYYEKYTIQVELMRIIKSEEIMMELLENIPDIVIANKKEKVNNEKLLNDFLDISLSNFEESEENMKGYESRQNRLVETYNFEPNKIINHSRNLENINDRILYLQMILLNYQDHEQARNNELINLNIRLEKDIQNILSQMLSLFSRGEDGLSNFQTMNLISVKERLERELNSLIILQSTTEERNISSILQKLNKPQITDDTKVNNSQAKNDQLSTENLSNYKSEYLTTKEIKAIFKVTSDVTINKWIKSGKLIPTKIGRKNIFKKSDIESLLKENRLNLPK